MSLKGIDKEGGESRPFSYGEFRRVTSKSVKKLFEKVLTFSVQCGIILVSEGERLGSSPKAEVKPPRTRTSRWGMAVGVLISEDCGEEGNPC